MIIYHGITWLLLYEQRETKMIITIETFKQNMPIQKGVDLIQSYWPASILNAGLSWDGVSMIIDTSKDDVDRCMIGATLIGNGLSKLA